MRRTWLQQKLLICWPGQNKFAHKRSVNGIQVNKLKSVYVMAYFTMAPLMVTHALVALSQLSSTNTPMDWGWIGVIIAVTPIALYISALYLFTIPRTSHHLPQLQIPAALGLLIALYAFVRVDGSGIPLLYTGFICLFANPLYIYWYSTLKRNIAITDLNPGNVLPEFTIEDENGKPFNTANLMGKPALLMFYRGNWCPLCMSQVREVARNYQALKKRGVEILMISPQANKNTQVLARRFDVPMRFMRDPDNRVAKQLSILHKNSLPAGMQLLGYDSDAPYPTIILCDESLRILAAELTMNYRIRPEPRVFLELIDQHLANRQTRTS